MSPDLFLKLSTLGLSHEQMAGVLDVVKGVEAEHAEQVEKSRDKARARLQKWRDKQPKRFATSQDVLQRLTSTEEEKKQTIKQESKKERATRLPEDWTLPDEWRDEAVASGLSLSQALSEARKMLNWSLSDKNGAKLKWLATWRNWYQRALESQAKPTGPPKKVTVGNMWLDEARNLGILNDPASPSNRRVETRFTGGDHSTPGFARRIASTGSG